MRLSQLADRRSGRSKLRGRPAIGSTAIACVIDLLESRRLLSGETLSTPISPVLANTATPSANAITLNQNFTDASLPGTLVTFTTSLGVITVALTDAATPLTVANFLDYVNSGAYTNTIFHRTAVLAAGTGGSPSSPADIIQGGGYVVQGTNLDHIPTNAPVDDEYTTELTGDVAGTLAMAKTSLADSATSEWFFNVHNNVSALDTPTTDSNGTTTSYTVFGTVLTGMNVVDEIAALPTYNVSSSLNTVPVTGLTEGEATKNFPITAANLVYTDKITSQPGVSYTATSSDNSLVTPTVTNGVLSFTYASGLFGTANITVVAKSLDGSTASTTFAVTVPDTATPSAGPTAAAVTAPNIVTGTSGTFNVLDGDTDSVAALNQSSIAITTEPTNGTATVNASTGLITYTPTAGFTGSDTLSYTVADTAGTVSSPAIVTLNVVAPPATVTIGTAKVRSLTFTQPNGVTGDLIVRGGTAVVTFAGPAVVTSGTDGVDIVNGANIAGIVITNTGAAASLSLTASGAVDLGTVTDAGAMSFLDAPKATLTGDCSFGSIGRLILAGTADATLSLGSGSSTLVIPGATDTSVTSTGAIVSLISTQWLNDNGGYYILSTPKLGRLDVTGTFAEVLHVTAAGSALSKSTVGAASAAWTVAGSIGSATFANPASTFSLTANGSVGTLNIVGNLSSNLSAGTIGTLLITGTTTGSTITTTASASQIGRVRFGGAVSGINVSTVGSIGSVTATSLGSSNISAGAIGSVTVAGAATNADFTTDGTTGRLQIGRFHVGGNFNTSTISATGAIGPVTIASLTSSTFTAASISSVVVPGESDDTTFTTDGTKTSGEQIGLVRIGGAFNSSSISVAGGLGSVSALSISGSQFTGNTLGSVFIAGITNGATFQANANFSSGKTDMGRLIFGGAVQGTLITAAGNVGSVKAPSLTGVQIYAGVESSLSESAALPTDVSQFSADAHINSVVLARTGTAFSNSLISAEVIGSVHLGNVNSSNNGITEGIATHKISRVDATLVPGGVLDAGPAQLKSAAVLTAYETKKKVALGDFVVNLL